MPEPAPCHPSSILHPPPSLPSPPAPRLAGTAGRLFFLGAQPCRLSAQGFLSGIKLPEFFTTHELPIGSPNRLKGLLTSTNAQALTNGLLLLTQPVIMRLEPNGATNLVATSPACLVDPKLRIAFSTNRLTLTATNGQMTLEGQGFLCLLTNFNLTLSNRVHTRFPRQMARSGQNQKSPGGNALLPGRPCSPTRRARTHLSIFLAIGAISITPPTGRCIADMCAWKIHPWACARTS